MVFLTRNLIYYWRTNLAVLLGVAAAVAVLAGALLVGDSVRGSLRDLFLQRLGNTDHVVTTNGFFRERLASAIGTNPQFATAGFKAAAPLIAIKGTLINASSHQVASEIHVYGIDDRFSTFHERTLKAPLNREMLINENAAAELGCKPGDPILLRVEKPSDIPIESLHSRKEDLGRTLRLNVRDVLPANALGEFSVQAQQTPVRAVFVPLKLLQKELDLEDKANLILVREDDAKRSNAGSPNASADVLWKIVKDSTSLEDYGIQLRLVNDGRSISLDHDSKVINSVLAEAADRAARSLSMQTTPVLSYLANSIASSNRAVPYSLVTALDEKSFQQLLGNKRVDSSLQTPIVLNEWTARDLGVVVGDAIKLEYYFWHESGRLETRVAQFQLAGVVPIAGMAADRDLVPEYPGITGSEHLADWDPPFPVDLKRVRKQDEEYWQQYRTTPKAFLPLAKGQELWQTRFGKLTSLRVTPGVGASPDEALSNFRQKLISEIDAASMGIAVLPVRQQGMGASRGATDFGEYFLYFSFFLVISALLLSALFFKLGVEQRLREIGLLQALGFSATRVRRIFVLEGLVLSIIGSLFGLVAALAYGQLMMTGLNNWWKDAVGTNMLKLHVAPSSLLLGAAGGIVAGVVCIAWALRRLGRQSTRSLLMGNLTARSRKKERRTKLFTSVRVANVLAVLGLLILTGAALHLIGQTGGFFGGGFVLLGALLCYQSAWLRRDRKDVIHGSGWWPVVQLGFRNANNRPGRSLLCIALIASAAFIIVSVDSFRRTRGPADLDRKSGTGGYPLLAESLVALVHDPNRPEGREALNLESAGLAGVAFTRFRVRPGEDASCLNLYQPRNPRIVGASDEFLHSNRFTFQSSIAGNKEEKSNPWLLLNREFPDGAVPVIADANSLTYVLHLGLGEDFVMNLPSGAVKLRVVAALSDSIFQSEFVMAESRFVRLFPDQEGYKFFLIDTAPGQQSREIIAALEDRLSDFGFDVTLTEDRLANFHRVENTYLSTFQMLGGLGLLLGTVGLGAVLLRNVFERRRELALLRAVGYNSSHFTFMVLAENALLLLCGLGTGLICALLAIAPVFFTRGGRVPNISLGLLLLAVLISGLLVSFIATWAALKSPLLPALKAE